MFDLICKHLEGRQKCSVARRFFNSLLVVWKCGQRRSFVFDIYFYVFGRVVKHVWLNTLTLLMWLINFSVKKCPELPCHELFYAAKISLFFLVFSYLRFAGICEKRTKQDQRKVENILASNQQSEVENDFREFFDSSREDARDVIQSLYGSEEEIDIHVYYPIIACIILEVSYIRFHHLAILLNILPLKILNILSQG